MHAWIAEVERKLGKRTRVFLALTVIAIGIAGASLYLAIDARDSSVSESDVRALQQKLETRIDEAAAGGAAATPALPPVETEPTPAPQPEKPTPKPGGGSSQGSGSSGGNGASGGSSGAGSAQPQSSSGGKQDKSARVLELLEQAKKQNAEAEAEQKAK